MRLKLELIFPGRLKEEAIICYLCKKFEVIVNILEASFSTDTGWALLVFEGSEEEVKKAVAYLQNKGVEIKPRQ